MKRLLRRFFACGKIFFPPQADAGTVFFSLRMRMYIVLRDGVYVLIRIRDPITMLSFSLMLMRTHTESPYVSETHE